MSTLPDRTATALVVIDVQREVMAAAHRGAEVVATIAGLVDTARAQDVPVVWVQHADEELVHGSAGWQLVPELVPDDAEPVVHKHHGDAFEGTDLESVLAAGGVGRLVVAGAETDACVRSTIHGAFTRGYDVTLVSDAHTGNDMSEWGAPPPAVAVANVNLYWQFQSAPGRTAAVTPAAEVVFAT